MSQPQFTTRPTLTGTFGMVSATHWSASAAAMAVLESGGNAFDAAVTAGFVLHVVEPHLCGPGGDLPAIIATAADPRPRVLAGQGVAPAAATLQHYRGLGLDLVPGAGPLAAVVPGAVDAWLLLLRDHGTRSLREVLGYAIGYAAAGHPVGPGVVNTIGAVRELFTTDWPSSAAQWLPGGRVPEVGDLLALPEWSQTLQRMLGVAEAAGAGREAQLDAARAYWRGPVADALGAFAARSFKDSSGSAHPGVLTAADIGAWSASWEDPVVADWHGWSVAKTPAWGQGPVLLQALGLIDAATGGSVPDVSEVAGIHLVAESIALAMADREAWYGDGADVPLGELLAAGYAAERAALIGEQASLEFRPGAPGGRTPSVAALARAGFGPDAQRATGDGLAGTGGEPTVRPDGVTRGDTVHVAVVDRWGNMIAATPSGGWLQSNPTVPGLGFCLGSRLQMSWLDEASASVLRPGFRPRTTLTPTLVSRDGVPVLACGSPGGDQQDQWQLLFLLRHLGLGMDLQAAIDAPTWHSTSFPASFHPREATPGGLVVESRLGPAVIDALAARGHRISDAGPWSLGRMCVVTRDPATGVLRAGANPRGMSGYAIGR